MRLSSLDQGEMYRHMFSLVSRGLVNMSFENVDSTAMQCPLLGCFSVLIHVIQCIEFCFISYHPLYSRYLNVNDTNLCFQVIPSVVYYTHLPVSMIPKLGATRGIIMQEPWSGDVRPLSSLVRNSGLWQRLDRGLKIYWPWVMHSCDKCGS